LRFRVWGQGNAEKSVTLDRIPISVKAYWSVIGYNIKVMTAIMMAVAL
jgi:hypothetical protein